MQRKTTLASSALFAALAILPAGAFAQQTAAPVKPDAQAAQVTTAQAVKTPAAQGTVQATTTLSPVANADVKSGSPAIKPALAKTETKAPMVAEKTATRKDPIGQKQVTVQEDRKDVKPHTEKLNATHASPTKPAEPVKS